MIRIGCRAHDYGKHTPVQLAHILHTAMGRYAVYGGLLPAAHGCAAER